jgi:uncharacterized protein YigE (DUF2233 family)
MKAFWAWLISFLTLVTPTVSPLPSPSISPALMAHGEYRYASVVISDVSNLSLTSNLSERRDAAGLAAAKKCQFLTNAGFYDTSNQHLGWFYTQGEEISPAITNRLFDGFLSLVAGQAVIGFDRPEDAVWGVQSGPVLVHDGIPLKLSIREDQPRRRVVAAINDNQDLIFMVIVSSQSEYGGPLLADLPQLVKSIDPEIAAAINLDGGSASAFYSSEIQLKEYSPIGGYFCYTGL